MPTKFGIHAARHDIADSHVLLPVVEHHCFAHPVQSKLGGVVRCSSRHWIFARKTTYVDDPALARVFKSCECFAAAIKRSGEVCANDTVPLLNGNLRSRAECSASGIVD